MNKYFLSLLLMLPLSFVIFAQDNESEDDIEEVVVEEGTEKDNSTEENESSVDYSAMKVVELKELLKEKDLPVSGTKAELIERLQT